MTGDSTRFVALMVRATRARRVLEIGTGTGGSGLAIVEAMPTDGTLITLERDATTAGAARTAFTAAGHENRVSVMIGDASRYLHKIAGPFDLVFQDGDAVQFATLHDRLVQLLAPAALLLTNNPASAGGYNEVLAADARLMTMVLTIGDGLAVSVRRDHTTMTLEQWLEDGKSDAYRRKLPELADLLDGLARSTAALRAADWNDDAAGDAHQAPDEEPDDR